LFRSEGAGNDQRFKYDINNIKLHNKYEIALFYHEIKYSSWAKIVTLFMIVVFLSYVGYWYKNRSISILVITILLGLLLIVDLCMYISNKKPQNISIALFENKKWQKQQTGNHRSSKFLDILMIVNIVIVVIFFVCALYLAAVCCFILSKKPIFKLVKKKKWSN
jgi:hypothetical protein